MTIAILTALTILATFACIFAGQKWPALMFMLASIVLAVVA
jgi:hypothetical protein